MNNSNTCWMAILYSNQYKISLQNTQICMADKTRITLTWNTQLIITTNVCGVMWLLSFIIYRFVFLHRWAPVVHVVRKVAKVSMNLDRWGFNMSNSLNCCHCFISETFDKNRLQFLLKFICGHLFGSVSIYIDIALKSSAMFMIVDSLHSSHL